MYNILQCVSKILVNNFESNNKKWENREIEMAFEMNKRIERDTN